MADKREIVITLKGSSEKSTRSDEDKTFLDRKQEFRELQAIINNPFGAFIENIFSNDGGDLLEQARSMAGMQIANGLIGVVKTGANFLMQNAGRFTGDISAQRAVGYVNLGLEATHAVTGIVSSAISGAMFGSAFPGPGTAIGAAIGVIAGVGNVAINTAQTMFNYGNSIMSDNRSILFAQMRAGSEMSNWSR